MSAAWWTMTSRRIGGIGSIIPGLGELILFSP